MLDKMEKIEDPAITFNDAASLSIRFPDPGPLPKNELIQFDGLAFAYPGKTPLFQKATANLGHQRKNWHFGCQWSILEES